MRFMPEEVRRNMIAASGFGIAQESGNQWLPDTIAAGAARRFTHKPILSVFFCCRMASICRYSF